MIQYPKQEHVTLPSVESWGTSMNILRDPPKSLFTRQINKVGQTSQIVEEIGSQGGDRIGEYIKVYPRGVNPMVSVSYSNYGTNGGQYRGVTSGGIFGRNKQCRDGRSPYLGQAKLPYAAMKDGAFRPPVFRQEDLIPLSRLPRTNTEAYTMPGFVSYANSLSCNDKNRPAEKIREIQKNTIRYEVEPNATMDMGMLLKEPFSDLRQILKEKTYISAKSQKYGADRSQHINQQRKDQTKNISQFSTTAPMSMRVTSVVEPPLFGEHKMKDKKFFPVVSTKSDTKVSTVKDVSSGRKRVREDVRHVSVSAPPSKRVSQITQPSVNPDYVTKDVSYSNVFSNKSRNKIQMTVGDGNEKRKIKNVIYHSEDSRASMPGSVQTSHGNDPRLRKVLPKYQTPSRRVSTATVTKAVTPKNRVLQSKLPATSAHTSRGIGVSGDFYTNTARKKNIKRTLSVNAGFDGKATMPMTSFDRQGVADRTGQKQGLLSSVRRSVAER